MLFPKNRLKPLQRSSGILFGSLLILTMALFTVAHLAVEHAAAPKPLLQLIELLPTIPVTAMIFVVGRYLRRETDEFVRMLVVQSLLWALGVTMIANIVFGVVFGGFSDHGIVQIYDIDVFCLSGMAALAIQLRRAA